MSTSQSKNNVKMKEKPKKKFTAGKTDNFWAESIYYEGNPTFLTFDGKKLSLVSTVRVKGETFEPITNNQIPYRPYEYHEEEWNQVRDKASLYDMVFREIDDFLDLEDNYKHQITSGVKLTYQQDKFRTVPYLDFVGDVESGKSRALELLSYLTYRPMFCVSAPVADIYGYLEDDSFVGTILEDEIQGIEKEREKMKIYKTGYRYGAKVPRTIMTPYKRFIKYYNTYCIKCVAGERTSYDRGLMDRFIIIPMAEGMPRKEKVENDDLERFRKIRNLLLNWRLMTRHSPLEPASDLSLHGRTRELWEPLLSIAKGTVGEEVLKRSVLENFERRKNDRRDSLEGQIAKAVISLVISYKRSDLAFAEIWNLLSHDLPGATPNPRNPNEMQTQNFGKVTKNRIGFRLKDVFKASSEVMWLDGEPTRVYRFDTERLNRAVKKYYLSDFLTDLTGITDSGKTIQQFLGQKTHENTHNLIPKTSSENTLSRSVISNVSKTCKDLEPFLEEPNMRESGQDEFEKEQTRFYGIDLARLQKRKDESK